MLCKLGHALGRVVGEMGVLAQYVHSEYHYTLSFMRKMVGVGDRF